MTRRSLPHDARRDRRWHGKIALILERLLSQRGDSVAGFIRNPAHVGDLEAAGADALVVDLENASVDDVATHLQGADAVVFAAGAGPGSGAARKTNGVRHFR